MIEIEHDRNGILVCRAAGRLTKSDYDAAVPELENALKRSQGAPRVLMLLEGFKGWDIGGLWEELRFDVKHRNDFGRVAVVGESKFEEWGTRLSKPFFGAEVRYYDLAEREAAEAWLAQGAEAAAPR